MSTENKINENLKEVIERNFDAYQGYQKAADKVTNPSLANAFRNQAIQRKRFAVELESEAKLYNVEQREALEKGTFEASIHRTWMDVKTAFSSNKDEAVLEECLRGEKEALNEYNELINQTNFTGQPHQLITNQRDTVQGCINELQQLEKVVS